MNVVYTGKNKMKSKGLFKELKKTMNAGYFYNPSLKIIASKNNFRGLWEYYCHIAGLDNEKLRNLDSETKYLINFPEIQSLFLEKVLGYKKLK